MTCGQVGKPLDQTCKIIIPSHVKRLRKCQKMSGLEAKIFEIISSSFRIKRQGQFNTSKLDQRSTSKIFVC